MRRAWSAEKIVILREMGGSADLGPTGRPVIVEGSGNFVRLPRFGTVDALILFALEQVAILYVVDQDPNHRDGHRPS